MTEIESFESIARRAVSCDYCFANARLVRPSVDDLAQPRYIGEGYWTSARKVVVIMPNPGAGAGTDQGIHGERRNILKRLRDSEAGMDEVFQHQFTDMINWGWPPGKFMAYIQVSLGLSINEIALLNLAWCATQGDEHPKFMLDACYEHHTEAALKVLSPDVIILSGGDPHKYRLKVSTLFPHSKIFNVLHYAHRKSRADEDFYTSDVRKFLQSTP